MKNILESPEALAAQAEIDLNYLGLRKLIVELDKPVSNLEKLIDQASGHNPTLESAKLAVSMVNNIITAKKVLEADTSHDEVMLQHLKDRFKIK